MKKLTSNIHNIASYTSILSLLIIGSFSFVKANAKSAPKSPIQTAIVFQSKLNSHWVLSESNKESQQMTIRPNERLDNQKFVLEYGLGGAVFIKNPYSGKYLEVKDNQIKAGSPIGQGDKSNSKAQQFKLEYLGNGYYRIKSAVNQNLVVEVNVTKKGAPLNL